MTAQKRKLTPTGSGWMRGLHVPQMKLPEPTVTAMLYYDKAPETTTVIEYFEKHLWPLYRFSSLVKDGCFVPVEGVMDRTYHFVERDVKDESEVDAYAEKVMDQSLDRSHPLWQVIIIRANKGRSAVIVRIHHVIGDGIGFLFAFLPTISCEDGDIIDKIPLPGIFLGKKVKKTEGESKPGFLSRLSGWLSSCPRRAKSFVHGMVSLLIVKPDSEIKMNPPKSNRAPYLPYSGKRTYTRMQPIPLSTIKAVKNKHECTINDVIMAAFAGAIRRYNAEDLVDPLFQSGQKLDCKCTMLFALPRKVDRSNPGVSLCNNIVCPLISLPIDEPLALKRLQQMVENCNFVKSIEYLMGITFLTKLFTAILPTWLLQKTASNVLSSITCNYTNMPMPTCHMNMFGSPVSECQALFVNPGPQVCFVNYNGMYYWNVVADPALIPNPTALGKYLAAEMEELQK